MHATSRNMSTPTLGVVVAMTATGVIGCEGLLPWDLPEDRKLFRQLTLGGTVIMGRRTFESLPAPLADRCNIVISRSQNHFQGATTVQDLDTALQLARSLGRPIFVIGGETLYREALPLAATLHISWVEGSYRGDRHFPLEELVNWNVVESTTYAGFRHMIYRRAAASAKPPAPPPRR